MPGVKTEIDRRKALWLKESLCNCALSRALSTTDPYVTKQTLVRGISGFGYNWIVWKIRKQLLFRSDVTYLSKPNELDSVNTDISEPNLK